MKSLSHQDRQYLDAAEGWLGLGDHLSANEELEQITPELRADPRVLGVRLEIYWKDKNWEAVVHFASALATLKPRYVKQEIFALAPLPPQSIEQGMVGPGLLAQILVSKYEYHQPLYRQEKMFRQQFGVELSRKTMGSWVEQAAELLKLVYRSIREDLLRGNYLPAAKNTQIKEFTPRACAYG